MTNPGPTKEEYDSLIYKLATQKGELDQVWKLLEAPAKVGWWERSWDMGAKAVLLALVGVLVGLAAPCQHCYGVQLDAPIAPKKTTVRSEIIRGKSAIDASISNFRAINGLVNKDGILNTPGILNAITNVIDQNKQINMDTEPFYLGAYFGSWLQLAILIDSIKNSKPPSFLASQLKIQVERLSKAASLYFKLYHQKQEQLKIDDDGLMRLLNMNEIVVRAKIYEWRRKTMN